MQLHKLISVLQSLQEQYGDNYIDMGINDKMTHDMPIAAIAIDNEFGFTLLPPCGHEDRSIVWRMGE